MRFQLANVWPTGWPALGILIFTAAPLATQTHDVVRISVNDARPLMVALDELERKTGWIVTYEDPPWMFSDDLQDRSELTGKARDQSNPQPVPRGGAFAFAAAPRGVDIEAKLAFVQTLLHDYERSPVGRGHFQIVQTSGTLHVVPARSRNEKGQFESRSSVLDVNIAMRPGTRSAMDATTEWAQSLSQASGKKVRVFFVPNNLFIRSSVTTPAETSQESGREALMRIIGATGRRLSWRLAYLPDAYQGWALSIHEVVDPKK